MADIFISYARDDRDRVRPIADGLMAEGFSVWWDPDILPGTTFDEEIERELDAAKCALVVWSENSRTSRWVKTEAGEALDRDILIPLMLEDVKIPLAFRRIQAEPIIDWQGDRTATNWQRIMLQANALVGERGGVAVTEPAQAMAAMATADAPRSGAGSTFLITAIAALGLGAMWMFGDPKNFGIIGVTFALAALSFILFRFAESDLSPHMKAMASRWLLPVKGKVRVNAVEAFFNMFEAVFGRKHLSWRCIWRSALASTLGFILMLALFSLLRPQVDLISDPDVIFAIIVFGLVQNIIGDYLSLWETRILLRIGARRPGLLPVLILFDACLTFAIFTAGVLLVWTLADTLAGDSFSNFQRMTKLTIAMATQEWLDITDQGYDHSLSNELEFASVLGASLATAYITSIWLWLAVIFGPIARALVWSRTKGATFLGKLFDVEHRPFTALGYLTALFVIISGSLIWGASLAFAAMG